MPRPREFDPDLVLDHAVELFWAKGYEGTSISDLEEHLGMGRQSLYGAFGDKHELYLKAMDRYAASQSWTRRDLLKPDAGAEEIREYFKGLIGAVTKEPRRSCMLINAAIEGDCEHPKVAGRCTDIHYVGHHLVFPRASRQRRALRTFVEWITAELAQTDEA